MRIGILSDTHDQVQRTKSAVAMLVEGGAETLIHCGDLTIADVVDECSVLPCYFVFGNCDYDRESLREAINRVGGTCLERGGLISLGGVAWPSRMATWTKNSVGLRHSSPIIYSPATPMLPAMSRKAQRGGSIRVHCIALWSGPWHFSTLQASMSVC